MNGLLNKQLQELILYTQIEFWKDGKARNMKLRHNILKINSGLCLDISHWMLLCS